MNVWSMVDTWKAQYEEACAELEEARAGGKAAALLSQELDERAALTAKLKEQGVSWWAVVRGLTDQVAMLG